MTHKMELDQQVAFLEALNTMAVYFRDELNDTCQHIYWELFRDQCTLEEWQWSCLQAMMQEDFYKTPLFRHMREYIKQYRDIQRQVRDELRQKDLARAHQKFLENPPLAPDEMQAQLQSLFHQLGDAVSI